ncbi:Uu.00g001630.m01.CDS01 [Anthostomella pinea]|uniref:Uu.00g001630.m01.CDS01 n=1 Tax=Anthostomella pinea TaxID=933095 RepID=A0AAI8VJH0_9PEZI|nr:Uu.00g001630.m01.CDS01 [Anthostomella pinea]
MSNKSVREDIKSFVHGEISRVRMWQNKDADFLAEVEDKLVQEARGIENENIRTALKSLPPDIFATYERILTDIPERDQEFARTALALICSNTAEILVSSGLYNVPYGDISAYTVETLRDICGCLITLSERRNAHPSCFTRDHETRFHQVKLAHYTVKEYLFDPTTAQGPAKFFALSQDIVRNIDLTVIFNGLGHLELFRRDGGKCLVSRYGEYCLKMTENAVMTRRTHIIRNEELRKETGVLANLALLNRLGLAEKYTETSAFKELRRTETTRIWTQDFKLKGKNAETLLGFCVRRRQQKSLQLFIRGGATFNRENEILHLAMHMLYENDTNGSRTHQLLKDLLGACANPNPKPRTVNGRPSPPEKSRGGITGFGFTPLQIAVSNLEEDWVETLLEEGADANGTGMPKGALPSGWDEDAKPEKDLPKLRKMSLLTPLEICATTVPPWGDGGDLVNITRRDIEKLLKRYGARDAAEVEEENDQSVVDKMVVDLIDDVDETPAQESPSTSSMATQVASPRTWRNDYETEDYNM